MVTILNALFRLSYSLKCLFYAGLRNSFETHRSRSQTHEALKKLNQYHAGKLCNYGSLLPSAGTEPDAINSNRAKLKYTADLSLPEASI